MKKKTFDKVENGEAGAAAVAPASGRSKASFSEIFAKVIFIVCAVFSIVAVLTIVFYLLGSSFPALRKIGLFNFLFGRIWNNDKGLTNPSEYFGILPAIVSSLVVTLGAVVVGVVIFHESLSPARLLFVALLLVGIIGLKATSGH